MTHARSQFYYILDSMNTEFLSAGFRNIAYGNNDEIDWDRQTIFPMVHVGMPNATQTPKQTQLFFPIMAADLVDWTKNTEQTVQDERFYGVDNTVDIHQDILARLQEAFQKLGNPFEYQFLGLIYNYNYSAFKLKYKNGLAGWRLTAGFEVKNMDDGQC